MPMSLPAEQVNFDERGINIQVILEVSTRGTVKLISFPTS